MLWGVTPNLKWGICKSLEGSFKQLCVTFLEKHSLCQDITGNGVLFQKVIYWATAKKCSLRRVSSEGIMSHQFMMKHRWHYTCCFPDAFLTLNIKDLCTLTIQFLLFIVNKEGEVLVSITSPSFISHSCSLDLGRRNSPFFCRSQLESARELVLCVIF